MAEFWKRNAENIREEWAKFEQEQKRKEEAERALAEHKRIEEEEKYRKKVREERINLKANDLPTSDKKPKKFSMHEAVSKDKEYRPGMTGVYHSPKGDVVATDTRIMVVSKKEYNPDLKGKVVDKKGKPCHAKVCRRKGQR